MATNWTPLASPSPTVAAENAKNVNAPAPSVQIKGSFYSDKNQATPIFKWLHTNENTIMDNVFLCQ